MTPSESLPLRICIVGLFPDQQRHVLDKIAHYNGRLALKFIDENPAHRSDPLPDHVDYVIFSRFTDHSRWNNARAKYPPDTVFFCKGGSSMIIQKIFALAGPTTTTNSTTTITNTQGNSMTRTRKHYDEGYKQSAIELAERTSVVEAAAQLGISESMIYYWRDKARKAKGTDGATKPSTGINSDRIYWTEEELAKIADEWVLLRLTDPIIASATELFEKAQRKALPGERQRSLPGVAGHKGLVAAIAKSWKTMLDRPAVAPAPVEPQVEVITLEVPRKLTVEEMLTTLDEPALEALLSAKRLQRDTRFHELLASIAAAAGASHLPKVAPFVPALDLFQSSKKANPRVAIVGMPAAQNDELLAAVQTAGLHAQLRFPGSKDKEAVSHCDYAIIYRPNHGPEADRAVTQLGRNRVLLVDKHDTATIMQQLRNLTARQ